MLLLHLVGCLYYYIHMSCGSYRPHWFMAFLPSEHKNSLYFLFLFLSFYISLWPLFLIFSALYILIYFFCLYFPSFSIFHVCYGAILRRFDATQTAPYISTRVINFRPLYWLRKVCLTSCPMTLEELVFSITFQFQL